MLKENPNRAELYNGLRLKTPIQALNLRERCEHPIRRLLLCREWSKPLRTWSLSASRDVPGWLDRFRTYWDDLTGTPWFRRVWVPILLRTFALDHPRGPRLAFPGRIFLAVCTVKWVSLGGSILDFLHDLL